MRITNRLNLPDALVAAVANDDYSKGDADLSVTELIAPARQVELLRLHADETEEDAADRIWLLMGKVAHGILERAQSTAVREERLFAEVDGLKISGAFDHLTLDDAALSDYKVTSVWAVKHAADKAEWEQQLNLYAWLARRHHYDVKRLRIVAICRDWRLGDAAKHAGEGYPQHQVAVLDQALWSNDKAERFIRDRVAIHKAARVHLPECSPEERWQRSGGWALMKPGAVRATRVLAREDEARALAAATKDMRVVRRDGVSVRCQDYCAVAQFCTQFQMTQKRESAA